MPQTIHQQLTSINLNKLLLLSSFSVTLFFAFIDEGYYSFGWLKEPAGWLMITIYTGLFFGLQVLVFKVALRNYPFIGKGFSLLLILMVWYAIFVLSLIN